MRALTLAAATFAAITIVGCSSGPSHGEMEAALKRGLEATTGAEITVNDVKFGDCEKAEGRPGYACSATGSVGFNIMGMSQEMPVNATMVFDEIDGDWRLVGGLGQ